MTKEELQKEIIKAAESIPSTYGEYKIIDSLYKAVARIMGYKITTFLSGQWVFSNNEEHDKTRAIINGMEKQGIIKKSKSHMAYKMNR